MEKMARRKWRFDYSAADGKKHKFRARLPREMQNIYDENLAANVELAESSRRAAMLASDLAHIQTERFNIHSSKPLNAAEAAFELQFVAGELAEQMNPTDAEDENAREMFAEEVAELASASEIGRLRESYLTEYFAENPEEKTDDLIAQNEILARLLPENLANLWCEFSAGTSAAARFAREISDILKNPDRLNELNETAPELEIKKLLESTHVYIHSTETTRVPLLNPLRHENNAEHSLENTFFQLQFRDHILKNNPARAEEFDKIGDKSFRQPARFQALHDLTEFIIGDVQTCTISESDKRAKELVEASVAPLLALAFPQFVVEKVVKYEDQTGVFRQGAARTADKLGPGALDRVGRERAGQACMEIYGIDNPAKLWQNELRMAHGKIREFYARQPELIGAYVVQMTEWIGEFIDFYATNPTRFATRAVAPWLDKKRLSGHENCARCDMNDKQILGAATADLEKNPQVGEEKERKYSVAPDAVESLCEILNDPVEIEQIYLSDEINLRVRKVADATGKTTYLATAKGAATIDKNGKTVREEAECHIDAAVFEHFAAQSLPRVAKTRYRNLLLPGLTLDIFKNSAHAPILESEDVAGISPPRIYLLDKLREAYENRAKIVLARGKTTDNQTIALKDFGEKPADFISPRDIDTTLCGDFSTDKLSALAQKIYALAGVKFDSDEYRARFFSRK